MTLLDPIIRKRLAGHLTSCIREVKNTWRIRHALPIAKEVLEVLDMDVEDETIYNFTPAVHLPGWAIQLAPQKASPHFMTPHLRRLRQTGFRIIYSNTPEDSEYWSWHLMKDGDKHRMKIRIQLSFHRSMTCQLVETGEVRTVPVRKLLCR